MSFQTLSSLSDWSDSPTPRYDWLRVPSSKHQQENLPEGSEWHLTRIFFSYATAGCHVNARLEANSYIEVQLLKGELFGHPFMFSTFTGNLIGR